MLNRRIIRGKVLQQIFAFKISMGAHADSIRDAIVERFSPDLNSMEPQDPQRLEGLAKMALVQFENYIKTGETALEGLPEEVLQAVPAFIRQYEEANKKDFQRMQKKLVPDAELMYQNYLYSLSLLPELADKLHQFKKNNAMVSNMVIQAIRHDKVLQQQLAQLHVSWTQDQDVLADIISEIHDSPATKSYLASTNPEWEDQKQFVLNTFRNLVFKNAQYSEFMENKNIFWEEDKASVKDMVGDTIKSVVQDQSLEVAKISKNWEDDKKFMNKLFDITVAEDRNCDRLIAPKLKNWDISRLTLTDNLIIKMCLSEMMHFAQIPVKVSLNEYIELSKRYSSPKSKTLINGVLDTLSVEMVANGQIKKSGRGLIDNK